MLLCRLALRIPELPYGSDRGLEALPESTDINRRFQPSLRFLQISNALIDPTKQMNLGQRQDLCITQRFLKTSERGSVELRFVRPNETYLKGKVLQMVIEFTYHSAGWIFNWATEAEITRKGASLNYLPIPQNQNLHQRFPRDDRAKLLHQESAC
jgi:hypothetical protein